MSSVIIKSDSLFYYKCDGLLLKSATILLQSATIITKCDRTTLEFLKFGISKHPARRDRRRGYWLPTWLSGVFYQFERKGHTLPNCNRRLIIRPYQATQHRSKKNTFDGAAFFKRPSECEIVQWHYHWAGETGLHRKSDSPRNHCRYLPLSPTPCLV